MLLEQIKPKILVSKKEIDYLCGFFKIGSCESYKKIIIGNINTNYYVKTNRGEFVFRFYTFKKLKHIKAEHELLDFLYKKGFPTPRPIVLSSLNSFSKYKGCWVACFDFSHGLHIKKATKTDLKEVARITAQLHVLTKNYKNLDFDSENLVDVKKGIKSKRKVLIKEKFKDASLFCDFLEQELGSVNFPISLPKGVVHVDIKDENVLFFKHHFETLLDFDNAYQDYFIIDIGSCILWWCTNKDGVDSKKMKIFLEEYERHRKMSVVERKYLVSAIKFNALKQAFKYAFICLPKKAFAEKKAYYFLKIYKKL